MLRADGSALDTRGRVAINLASTRSKPPASKVESKSHLESHESLPLKTRKSNFFGAQLTKKWVLGAL